MKPTNQATANTSSLLSICGMAVLGLTLMAGGISVGAAPSEKNKALSVRLEVSNVGPTPRMVTPSAEAMRPISSAGLSRLRSLKGVPRQQSRGPAPFVVDRPHPKDGAQARGSRNAPTRQCSSVLPCTTYSLSRVANSTVNSRATTLLQPAAGMPYAATGRLHVATTNPVVFDRVCTAALIGRGIIVTAANCVSKPGAGSQGIAKAVRFIPANTGNTLTSGPYGAWAGAAITVPNVYANGTDLCVDEQNKAGCLNDLAVILLAKQAGKYPSDVPQISYYRYSASVGSDRYFYGCRPDYTLNSDSTCPASQLGFDMGLDGGRQMQRNDTLVYWKALYSTNRFSSLGYATTPMRRGSEGSPLIVHLGTVPAFTGASPGAYPLNNVMVALISWHSFLFSSNSVAQLTLFGWSPGFEKDKYESDGINYGGGNIGYLVNEVCRSDGPAHLRGKPKGACLTAS